MQPHRTLGDNVAESGQISRHQPGTRSSLDGQAAIVDALDPLASHGYYFLLKPGGHLLFGALVGRQCADGRTC
jgi:hypothetical protein